MASEPSMGRTLPPEYEVRLRDIRAAYSERASEQLWRDVGTLLEIVDTLRNQLETWAEVSEDLRQRNALLWAALERDVQARCPFAPGECWQRATKDAT